MCTRYPIINRVSELKVHIELTRFVQPEKIEIDANERQLMKSLNTAFSFAPPSILSLTILSGSTEKSNLTIILAAATPINMEIKNTIMIPNWYGGNIPIGRWTTWWCTEYILLR